MTANEQGGRKLRDVGRFEWEELVFMGRWTGCIGGSKSRGGVSASTFKAVALAWSRHASPDGADVFPGDATVAVEAEVGLKVAKAVKGKLLELGLLSRVRAGARRRHGVDEYRLTVPADLIDLVEVLNPAQVRLAAERLRSANRRRGSDGPHTTPDIPPGVEGPMDPVRPVDNGVVEGPSDPTQDGGDEVCMGSDGPDNARCLGSDGAVVWGPMAPRYISRPPNKEHQPKSEDLRTAVTVVGVPAAAQKIDFPARCVHGLPDEMRTDGRHACAVCRRELATSARASPARASPPPALVDALPSRTARDGPLAPVLPFRRPSRAV